LGEKTLGGVNGRLGPYSRYSGKGILGMRSEELVWIKVLSIRRFMIIERKKKKSEGGA